MTATTSTPLPQHRFRPGSARAALSYPDFRTMWVGSFASNIGTWMQNVVLPAYVYQRTGKASVVGLLVFAQLGPLLILAIPGGVIADRFDRRNWLIAMQTVQLVFSAALAPLAAHDAPIWALFLVQLGVGIGNALNMPAWSAMLPTLVSRQDLPGAISLNSTMINGSRVVGPIIVAGLSVDGRHDLAVLPHQRGHVPVRDRRPRSRFTSPDRQRSLMRRVGASSPPGSASPAPAPCRPDPARR